MEKMKSRIAPPTKDIIARGYVSKRAKRTKSAVTGTSTMLVESADVPPPSRLTLKKGKSIERVLPCNWSEEVNLGKGVSLNLDPAFFKVGEDFGLTVDVGDIRKEGLPTMTGYAISQIIKGLQAPVVLKEDVGSSVLEHKAMESSMENLKEEVRALKVAKFKLEKEASDAKVELKKLEVLLEKEKGISQELRDEMEAAVFDAAIEVRRDMMVEFDKGAHIHWQPLEEIERLNSILDGTFVGDAGGKKGGEVVHAVEERGGGSIE